MRRAAFVTAMLLTAAATLLAADEARAEKTIRWKFKDGQVLNYVLVRNTDGALQVQGNALQLGMGMTFDTTWKVHKVAADGTADVGMTVDRIQIAAKLPVPGASGEIKVDTKRPESVQNPFLQGMSGLVDALLGQEFALKVTPLGEVTQIEFPEKLQQMFAGGQRNQGGAEPKADEAKKDEKKAEAPRRGGGRRGGGGIPGMNAFTEDGVKQIIKQMIVPVPEAALSDEVTWTQTFETVEAGAGVQTSETKYSYGGSATEEGRPVEKLTTTTELFFEPAEDAQADVELGEQEGSGTVYFDAEAGHVLKVEGTQKYIKEMSTPRGDVVQDITEKYTMTLGKSPEPEAKPAKKSDKKDESK